MGLEARDEGRGRGAQPSRHASWPVQRAIHVVTYVHAVQVCSRRLILARGYDTSYRSLARRAQRSGSALNRLVRSGGVARRLLMFGE